MSTSVTIIIPVLNESQAIQNHIDSLKWLAQSCAVLFIDGHSSDNTVDLLRSNHLKVLTSPFTGRGAQLACGISHLNDYCDVVLMLHIDTQLPESFKHDVTQAMKQNAWGHFDVCFNSNALLFKIIQTMMNWRSRITGIATGDQAIFVSKSTLKVYVNELSNHPLMEDIYLSKMLKKKFGRGTTIQKPVITSTRYWQKNGVFKAVIRMWKFRFLYSMGTSPKELFRRYY